MIILLDSNILLYLTQGDQGADADIRRLYALTIAALAVLARRGAEFRVTPQVLIEFWAAATRPRSAPGSGARSGLGMTPEQADAALQAHLDTFALLADRPGVFRHWHALVRAAGVSGRHVHDARLVAVCLSYKADALLTHNGRDFGRFIPHAPGLAILDPAAV